MNTMNTIPADAKVVALSKQPRLFRIWVYEIAHGCTPFMNRSLMMETCAGIVEASSWEELGQAIDQGISVDGQTVSRIECITPMRSSSAFYDAIGAAHKSGQHAHASYHLPHPTPVGAPPSAAAAPAQVAVAAPAVIAPSPLQRRMRVTPFMEFFKQHEHEGSTYQPHLREQLAQTRPNVLVETGSGASTCFMTLAMEEGGFGHLYSIDPHPWCGYSVKHTRVTNIRRKSVDALPDLYRKIHPWDLFLHDSNHDLFCQAWELEFGYACLRPGGWLWCDDYTWGEHHAWDRFTEGKKTYHFHSAEAVQKQIGERMLTIEEMPAFVDALTRRLQAEAAAWRAAGHPDSEVFAEREIEKEVQTC